MSRSINLYKSHDDGVKPSKRDMEDFIIIGEELIKAMLKTSAEGCELFINDEVLGDFFIDISPKQNDCIENEKEPLHCILIELIKVIDSTKISDHKKLTVIRSSLNMLLID